MSDSALRLPERPSLEHLRKQAKELLHQIRVKDSGAQARFLSIVPAHSNSSQQQEATLAQAQLVLAREYGFESWGKLVRHVEKLLRSATSAPAGAQSDRHGLSASPPFYRIDWNENIIEPRQPLSENDWDTIFGVMREMQISGLNALGQMTSAALERLSKLENVTRLKLGGCRQLTDEGLLHLARMPQLQELDFSDPQGQISDRGLEVLRRLPELRRVKLCWQPAISDRGIANLALCDHLESVDLMGTQTGDGAIQALTGKARLRSLKTGRLVTDTGLPLLHQFPIFKTWQDGEIKYSLMSADAEPNHLLLDGSFTDKGFAGIAGLDGLFGLSLFCHVSALKPEGLKALTGLLRLGFLGCQGELCDDIAMEYIGAIPQLRMLMCQGTVAGDEGFAALSRSQTIEYVWGRQCSNLSGRGFVALRRMPELRGLAVSCKNVDDRALSSLPVFLALKEFMPMDVPDEGFRHVGHCQQLEALWCMYCRDTGDIATAHISGLSNLQSYYAGSTQITDRSLEILGGMSSLERLEFWQCVGITDAGLTYLARLPRLSEISIARMPNVTREGAFLFPANVRVDYST